MLASAMLSVPDQMLARDYVRELGSANIFSVKTLDQLEFGVPQCVLATAWWCQFGGVGLCLVSLCALC